MKIKWIVTGFVALVVALAVAGVAILSTMEFEELRGVIEAEAKEATGRELKIAGPIDLVPLRDGASLETHLEHRDFTAEEVAAICDEAAGRGMRVAAHAHTL